VGIWEERKGYEVIAPDPASDYNGVRVKRMMIHPIGNPDIILEAEDREV
jgi:hypothetical protein